MSPTLAEIAKAGQATPGTPEWKRKAILATNAAGVVAAPAAIGMAVRSARSNEGGTPRSLSSMAADKLERSGQSAYSRAYGNPTTGPTKQPPPKPVGRKRMATARALRKPIRALNTKAGRAGKWGALAAGAGMVGLQGAQSIGDALAAHENMGKKPKARAAAAIARRRGEVDKGLKTATKGALKRLKPNQTQQKVIGVAGAGGLGYAAGKQRQKAKQQAYDPYYGGY